MVHEGEGDLEEEARAMFGGTQGCNATRAPRDTRDADVIASMEERLQNLQGMVWRPSPMMQAIASRVPPLRFKGDFLTPENAKGSTLG